MHSGKALNYGDVLNEPFAGVDRWLLASGCLPARPLREAENSGNRATRCARRTHPDQMNGSFLRSRGPRRLQMGRGSFDQIRCGSMLPPLSFSSPMSPFRPPAAG
jgi:hypothetical protein